MIRFVVILILLCESISAQFLSLPPLGAQGSGLATTAFLSNYFTVLTSEPTAKNVYDFHTNASGTTGVLADLMGNDNMTIASGSPTFQQTTLLVSNAVCPSTNTACLLNGSVTFRASSTNTGNFTNSQNWWVELNFQTGTLTRSEGQQYILMARTNASGDNYGFVIYLQYDDTVLNLVNIMAPHIYIFDNSGNAYNMGFICDMTNSGNHVLTFVWQGSVTACPCTMYMDGNMIPGSFSSIPPTTMASWSAATYTTVGAYGAGSTGFLGTMQGLAMGVGSMGWSQIQNHVLAWKGQSYTNTMIYNSMRLFDTSGNYVPMRTLSRLYANGLFYNYVAQLTNDALLNGYWNNTNSKILAYSAPTLASTNWTYLGVALDCGACNNVSSVESPIVVQCQYTGLYNMYFTFGSNAAGPTVNGYLGIATSSVPQGPFTVVSIKDTCRDYDIAVTNTNAFLWGVAAPLSQFDNTWTIVGGGGGSLTTPPYGPNGQYEGCVIFFNSTLNLWTTMSSASSAYNDFECTNVFYSTATSLQGPWSTPDSIYTGLNNPVMTNGYSGQTRNHFINPFTGQIDVNFDIWSSGTTGVMSNSSHLEGPIVMGGTGGTNIIWNWTKSYTP